tara:strand:- start:174 stop:509 length:336 start_codon:yes stop_codon:yes gene_type:complete
MILSDKFREMLLYFECIKLKKIKLKAEKKCPILSSAPEKLAILPGIKDLKPKMFDLKISSKVISNKTTRKINDHILYNLIILVSSKEIINCLNDIIKPIIRINFNILGYVN